MTDTGDQRRPLLPFDLTRFQPEPHETPDEPRPDHFPRWWWARLEISSNTHRSFGHTAPLTRGWLHQAMVLVWPVLAWRLVAIAPDGAATIATVVYVLCMQAMFSASALTHLRRWGVWATEACFRLDHTGIFLAIGGGSTMIAGLTLDGWARVVVLGLMWSLTILGAGFALTPKETPHGFGNTAFLGGSALVLPFTPIMAGRLGLAGTLLLIAGGATYVVGAVMLAFQRPNPWPKVFGYHEVWHLMVVLGALLHYVLVERYVLPLAG